MLKTEWTNEFQESDYSRDCVETLATVLTTTIWPMNATTTFEVAPDLKNSMKKFTQVYQERHNGRRLSYLLTSCRGEMASDCFGKKYSFIAALPQMSTLDLFNDSTMYSFDQIREKLKIPSDVIKVAMQSMVRTELLKVTSGSLEGLNATLVLNEDFQSTKVKIDLTKLVGKAETCKDADRIQEAIEQERNFVMQAAIVRIMKMRKTLKYGQLIAETLTQLTSRFNPKVPSVKKAIDVLIEREYIKRQESSFETIEYIA